MATAITHKEITFTCWLLLFMLFHSTKPPRNLTLTTYNHLDMQGAWKQKPHMSPLTTAANETAPLNLVGRKSKFPDVPNLCTRCVCELNMCPAPIVECVGPVRLGCVVGLGSRKFGAFDVVAWLWKGKCWCTHAALMEICP